MKILNFYLFLMLIFFSYWMYSIFHEFHEIGPNDLFAFEVFGTKNPQEQKQLYKQLALKFHPDKYHGPQAEEIFKIVDTAYKDIMSGPMGGIMLIHNSKEIFETYIVPYLNELKKITEFEKIVSLNGKLNEELSNIEHPQPIRQLNDIIPTIEKLKKILKDAENHKIYITKELARIKNFKYKEITPAKVKDLLEKINSFKPITAKDLESLIQKTKKRIQDLEPLKIFAYIDFLEELQKGNEMVKEYSKQTTEDRILVNQYIRTIGLVPYFDFLELLRKEGVVESNGEIKSLEKIYKMILKYLNELKQTSYLKKNDPDTKNLLQEIQEKEQFYINKSRQLLTQPLINLTTLQSLANIAKK